MTDLLTLSNGRVAEPEGKTREYKRDLSSPDRVLRTVAAFANSAGGQLVIGVDDDGTVVGVTDPLEVRDRLANLIAEAISPLLVPSLEIATLSDGDLGDPDTDDRDVVVCEVTMSSRRPHHLARLGVEDGTFVRLGASNRQADRALVNELARTAQGIA